MLAIDMAGLSEAGLEKIVADRCSRYGRIASVRVVLPAGPARFAVALVRMCSPRALDDLVVHVGGTKSGSTAIIRLEQEEPDGVSRGQFSDLERRTGNAQYRRPNRG